MVGDPSAHTDSSHFNVSFYLEMQGTSDPAEYLLILSTKYFSVVNVSIIY